MADLSGLDVAWPVLDAPADPAAAAGTPAPAVDAATRQRYTIAIEGLDTLAPATAAAVRLGFDSLSELRKDRGDPANAAQLDRRARDDAELLVSELRAYGFYDAEVDPLVRTAAAGAQVSLRATPGPLYRFSAVTVTGLDAAGAQEARLRAAFPIKPGDPVEAERVQSARTALATQAASHGFAFAQVPDPQVVVDHASRAATLELAVSLGGSQRFGQVVVEGNPPFSAAHVQAIARFRPGDSYDATMLEDLRRALVATGLVSSVRITPQPGARTGIVDLHVRLDRAPPRTIAGELGYGSGEGARLELSWQHRNFFPPEGAVTFSGLVGTREQQLGALYRRSNFHARDEVLTGQLLASHSNFDAYDARTFDVSFGIERQTNIIWQKTWTWSLGTEFLASDERGTAGGARSGVRRTYVIAALPGSLGFDGSDDLLNPTRGYRLAARVSPELSLRQGTFGYARIQLDASAYRPVTAGTVIAGRVRVGSIAGAHADLLAPSRRFYAGGGGSVRGYAYQAIGPRDLDNDPLGGRSLAEFSAEARFRFGDFGVVPFFDGGNIYRQALPRFTGLRYGAGIGARYYTSFGPIRFDVGTPLDRRRGDSRIAVYVSLGQAF